MVIIGGNEGETGDVFGNFYTLFNFSVNLKLL